MSELALPWSPAAGERLASDAFEDVEVAFDAPAELVFGLHLGVPRSPHSSPQLGRPDEFAETLMKTEVSAGEMTKPVSPSVTTSDTPRFPFS